MRPDWDTYWYGMAAHVATRATCPRAAIGAVLVRDRHLIGTGYNGVQSGEPHCPSTPEHMALDHCREAIHAERNALTNALVPAFGSTLYVVGPRTICPDCRDALKLCGVTDIRWQPSVLTLDTALVAVVAWQRVTFPHEAILPAVIHMLRECGEVDHEPENGEELADALMLAASVRDRVIRMAEKAGIDLAAEVALKLMKNRRRTWGQPDANGVVEHVREASR